MTLKKFSKYQFYSCLDSKLNSTQPEQHYMCNKKAEKENGEIVFYGSEEYSVLEHQPYILYKLSKTPNIDGVIFFTFNQFCYSQKFNIKLLYDLLSKKKSVHFSREDISLYKQEDLESILPSFIAYYNSFNNRVKFAKQIISVI